MPSQKILVALIIAMMSTFAYGHSGKTNADGCHNNRKTGDYHCHGKKSSAPQLSSTVKNEPARSNFQNASLTTRSLPSGCFVGPRGGTYTITRGGRKNYGGC